MGGGGCFCSGRYKTCIYWHRVLSLVRTAGGNDLILKLSSENDGVIFGIINFKYHHSDSLFKKVQVGKDQEKAQSEKDSHSKNRGGKKTKLTIRYIYHETNRKPNEQLFSQ